MITCSSPTAATRTKHFRRLISHSNTCQQHAFIYISCVILLCFIYSSLTPATHPMLQKPARVTVSHYSFKVFHPKDVFPNFFFSGNFSPLMYQFPISYPLTVFHPDTFSFLFFLYFNYPFFFYSTSCNLPPISHWSKFLPVFVPRFPFPVAATRPPEHRPLQNVPNSSTGRPGASSHPRLVSPVMNTPFILSRSHSLAPSAPPPALSSLTNHRPGPPCCITPPSLDLYYRPSLYPDDSPSFSPLSLLPRPPLSFHPSLPPHVLSPIDISPGLNHMWNEGERGERGKEGTKGIMRKNSNRM